MYGNKGIAMHLITHLQLAKLTGLACHSFLSNATSISQQKLGEPQV